MNMTIELFSSKIYMAVVNSMQTLTVIEFMPRSTAEINYLFAHEILDKNSNPICRPELRTKMKKSSHVCF